MHHEIQEIQVASFRLGVDLYAIDIMRIKEIIRPLKLTSLPRFPDFVEGIINLRGIVMPVVDLRNRFGLPEIEISSATRLLIVKLAGQIIALVVDEVSEVVTVSVKDIKPPPHLGEGIDAEYLLGVCLVKDEMIMLLNIDRLLSSHETRELGKIQGGLREA
jgi:purine-binding chemotaxis protein CheW